MDEPPQVQALPHYGGLPVPWIALWEAERVGPEIIVDDAGHVHPAPLGRNVRREFDMWCIAGPDNRTGAPDFGSTHSRRQRECMTVRRCQVCGRTPSQVRAPHWWVVPNEPQHRELWEEARMVLNAPVCESCMEFAETVCPHLITTKPWHMTQGPATPVVMTGDLNTGHGWIQTAVALRSPIRACMVGRELIVQVAD